MADGQASNQGDDSTLENKPEKNKDRGPKDYGQEIIKGQGQAILLNPS